MASRPADTDGTGGAAFMPVLALTVALALAATGLVMAVAVLVIEPLPIQLDGLETTQSQSAETVAYLAAFGLILPIAIVAVPRLANTIAAGPNGPALTALAALMVATLAAAIIAVRLSGLLPRGGGARSLLLATGLWSVVAAAVLGRAAQPLPWGPLLRIAGLAGHLWAAAAVLALGALVTVVRPDSVSPLALLLGAALMAAVLILARRRPPPRLRGPWGLPADGLVVGVVLLAVIDLVIVSPENPASLTEAIDNGIVQFHHDFLLGPANQVLGGHPMLIDTASQYGVGSILLLAGWFQLAPIGYGTFGLLDGLLTALTMAAGYCVLRLAGVSRLLSASALGLGVIVLVLNHYYPVGALPQEGPLRFGLPMLLVLAAVAGGRWPRCEQAAQAAGLGVLGLSSIWSAEAFVATGAVFAALACVRAYLLPAGGRLGHLARQALLAAAACACAHLLFAILTLAGSGELPDWGQYLAYLEVFLLGRLGDVTYDFTSWSPGLALGAGYLVSSAAVVLLVRARPTFARQEQLMVLALTGTTAYGVVIFGYLVDRSMDHVVAYVSLPALLAGTLWLSLVLRSPEGLSSGARTGLLALVLSLAVVLVAVAWSSIGPRFEHSALAHVFPGGPSTRAAVDRLRQFPPFKATAPAGERLLDRYTPGQPDALVLAQPDLATEILVRSGRSNRLPIAYPWGDSFVAGQRVPGLRQAVAGLRAGERMLLDRAALVSLARIRTDPAFEPLARAGENTALKSSTTAPVQDYALAEIESRFRLRPLHSDRDGFTVVELEPRS